METAIDLAVDAVLVLLALAAIGAGLWVAIWVALLPGRLAVIRNSAHKDTIRKCGLIGILVWPAWVIAIIWALAEKPSV